MSRRDRIKTTHISAEVKEQLHKYCEDRNILMYEFVSQEILKAIKGEEIDRDQKKWSKRVYRN